MERRVVGAAAAAAHPLRGSVLVDAQYFMAPSPRVCSCPHHSLPSLPPPLPQSGIDVTDELLNLYEEVKLRHKHKYFVFSLKQTGGSATKTTWDWEVNHKAGAVADDKNLEAFTEMMKSLPTDEARFIIFDFADTKADGRQIKKLILIKW